MSCPAFAPLGTGSRRRLLLCVNATAWPDDVTVATVIPFPLAPVLVSRTIDAIKRLKDHYQLTVLMAEQNFMQAVRIADRGYVIVHGKIAFEGGSADELNNNDLIRQFYLGLES